MEQTSNLIDSINRCLLPKLAKNYDEKESHIEYDIRKKNFAQNFQTLENCLQNVDLLKLQDASAIISSLLNLYMELNSDCPWNGITYQDYSKKLNIYFELSYNVRLDNILYINKIFNKGEIFYMLLEALHKKLTVEEFKKYPGQVEVYCCLIKNLKEYDLKLKLQQVMPASLILLEDYIPTNKIKGLRCCLSILKSLTAKDFEDGNYYEVIYRSLMKTFLEKDVEVSKLTHLCLLELCTILPSNVKHNKLEDLYSNTLDGLYTESNLYKKAECLKFTRNIINMHKDNCIGNSYFLKIIVDNLEICTNDSIAEIILKETLQCLEEWIKYCWCIWKFSSNHKIISKLLKILYICKDEETSKYVQKIIVTLIKLCTVEEQKQINSDLDHCLTQCSGNFKEKLIEIKDCMNTT